MRPTAEVIEAGAFDFLQAAYRDDLATTLQLAMTACRLLRDIKAARQRLSRYVERLDRLATTMPAKGAAVREFVLDLLGEAHLLGIRVRESHCKKCGRCTNDGKSPHRTLCSTFCTVAERIESSAANQARRCVKDWRRSDLAPYWR